MPIPRHRRGARLVAMAALALGGCGPTAVEPRIEASLPAERPTLPSAYRPTGLGAAGAVFVHLFEWRWADVAAECEGVLGPAGWTAVQVSPPQEHAIVTGFPWYQRYQAVSHSVARSRSGTEAEFRNMIQRCRAAGVGIYVDAIVNHMSASDGTGSNGTVYRKYEYPGLFTSADFHTPCSVTDYQRAANVQDCELLGLADLHTGKPEVRQKIAAYLLSLVRMGVAGFRLDAAKHIQPVELDDILDRVNQGAAAEGLPLPYFFGEVIDYGSEAVTAAQYFGLGYGSGGAADLTEFRFQGVAEKFLGTSGQKVSDLRTFSESGWGLMPSDKAVVFLENHDTQREPGRLGYRHGNAYRLANVFMLAQPYGYPSVMSSFGFDLGRTGGRDAGPPSGPSGETRAVTCAARMETATVGEWVCEHRDAVIAAMVSFRRAVAGTTMTAWWDNGGAAIAFSRGDKGFVALSRESVPLSLEVATPLPAGTYCDLLTGGKSGGACRGRQVVVGPDGRVRLDLAPDAGVAIQAGAHL